MSHGVSLQQELAFALPPVLGGRVRLPQVVMDLVMNGIQAIKTRAGPPTRIADTIAGAWARSDLIAVEDSGLGIEPENVDRLFNAFFTTKPSGMGIGLSICRSIIEQHDGRTHMGHSEFSGRRRVSSYIAPLSRDGIVVTSAATKAHACLFWLDAHVPGHSQYVCLRPIADIQGRPGHVRF